MGSSSWLIRLSLVALFVQFQVSLCSGCWEQETAALLQIKASIHEDSGQVNPILESWDLAYDDKGRISDCCGWEGVECNVTTGKVTKLMLNETAKGWLLNASLFIPFEDLTHLDLSNNDMESWVSNQGLGRLSALPKLEVLILGSNNFNNTILPSLGELSSLRILSLSENNLEGSFDFGELHNMINLCELDLEKNSITAIKGLEQLYASDKLEVLKLGGNYLDNRVLRSIGLHSTLKALSLHDNQLTGPFDVREFWNMSNLEELDLSYNSITSVRGLESLNKLTVLSLRGMNLNESSNGVLQQSVGALRSLKSLDMAENHLQSIAFSNGSYELYNLLELNLSQNDLEGMIPSWLGNLTSIQFLDLSRNQLIGNLASSPVADLHTLECLVLSNNNLEIPVSLISFFNHSKLKVFLTDNNNLISDKIEFHQSRVIPKFQLQVLSLTNSGSNSSVTKFPNFLYYQSDLRVIVVSHLNLAVPFPTWLLENNTLLEQCRMRNNSLTGPFLLPSHHLYPHSFVIDLSDNRLTGQLPKNLDRIFPSLYKLDISGNQFGGSIPASVGKLKYLETLDLSGNSLSGEIPKLSTIDCPSLRSLKLSHNNLSGQLSPALDNLTDLESLYLDDNYISGEIPDSFAAFALLELDLSNNHISGKLPSWIGNMTGLIEIVMASNHLEGSIPVEFCNLGFSFEFLDLSDNNLSGSIPSCFNPPAIRHVHLNRNKLSGPMTRAFLDSSSLVTLDLLDNNLTGAIPSWIGNLSSLSVLLLKLNNFEGEIPLQICNLKSLSLLDLSQNSLSGALPRCLSNMPFGTSHQKSSVSDVIFGSQNRKTPIYGRYVKRLRIRGDSHEYAIDDYESLTANQQVEFSTKYGSYSYKGSVLDLMSGIDLSCNHLTGEIPAGMGSLSEIHALNLSRNNLTGPIPTTFAKLGAIESLDLSYNNLNGRIPQQLVELVSLAIFSVAHNNLSGPVPDRKAQFGTFDEGSYEGNPLLCGSPLLNSCSTETGTGPATPQPPQKEVTRDDMVDFYASCLASYVTVLVTVVAILLINPRWRSNWFYFIEVWMTSSYYFVTGSFDRLINRRR